MKLGDQDEACLLCGEVWPGRGLLEKHKANQDTHEGSAIIQKKAAAWGEPGKTMRPRPRVLCFLIFLLESLACSKWQHNDVNNHQKCKNSEKPYRNNRS